MSPSKRKHMHYAGLDWLYSCTPWIRRGDRWMVTN
jgi:hypothetical protein